MPAALADSREGGLAQAHLELMSQHQADNEFLAIAPRALATSYGRRKDVRRMRWVLLPKNVVVVHAPDHQRIRQRRRNWIDAVSGTNNRCESTAGDFAENVEHDRYFVLLIAP